MLLLAALTIYTFRQIFTVFLSAYEADTLNESALKIDKNALESAYKEITEKQAVQLNVNNGTIITSPEKPTQ